MPRFSDLLDRMHVTVRSPDALVTAEVRNRIQIAVRFEPDTYDTYSESALGRQLSVMSTSLWVGYRRGYNAALSEAVGRPSGTARPWRADRRRFQDERDRLHVVGISRDGWVSVETTGMTRFEVDIEEGALDELSEDEFCAEMSSAASNLIRSYHQEVALLKHKHFNLVSPRPGRSRE